MADQCRSEVGCNVVLRFTIAVLPWFIPGVVLSMIVGLFASRPVAKVLATRRPIAWAIIVGFGVIMSATLTPLKGALNFEAVGSGTCDFSRIGLAPIEQLLRVNDSSLNVALFIPLGMAIGLVHVSRPWATLILAAIALPFAIEAIQLVAPILDRGCQSADVIDNLTGLALGLVIGTGLRILGGEVEDDREVRA
jgi:glycopeptide antibiotics resistance protein